MGKRKEPIPNLVHIPSEGSGPVWQDGVGNGYYGVRDKFMALLRMLYPPVATYSHHLPPVQRHEICRNIPDIKTFYGHGIMAPYVQMPPEQQEAISELYIEIGRAIQNAYKEGVRNGQNLLLNLAKGTVALSDFDEGVRIVEPKEEEPDADPESSS